jgi:type VI protein secretion system component VasK
MITWLLSQIPLWVYICATLLACAAAFWFLHPILVPLWAITPKWLRWTLGGIAAVIGAYITGMTAAGRAARERQKERERMANEHREELHRDIEKRSDTVIDRDFDKWVR